MRYQVFAVLAAASVGLAGGAAPAQAQTFSRSDPTLAAAHKWEATYLALSAIDAAQTIYVLESGRGVEANPIWGKNPSPTKIIGAKVGLGVVQYLLFREVARKSPKGALRLAQFSAGMQGVAVLLNARFVF